MKYYTVRRGVGEWLVLKLDHRYQRQILDPICLKDWKQRTILSRALKDIHGSFFRKLKGCQAIIQKTEKTLNCNDVSGV